MERFKVADNTLVVHTELESGVELDFREHCDQLLRSDGRHLTVDLSNVKTIVSSNIGVISALWVDVLSEERDLRVIVAAPVRKVLEFAGFHHVFTLIDGPVRPPEAVQKP